MISVSPVVCERAYKVLYVEVLERKGFQKKQVKAMQKHIESRNSVNIIV